MDFWQARFIDWACDRRVNSVLIVNMEIVKINHVSPIALHTYLRVVVRPLWKVSHFSFDLRSHFKTLFARGCSLYFVIVPE